MPTVIGAPASPFVRKVRVVLAEKKIPYDLEPLIPINVSPEFRRISPLGKIPVLRDGNLTLPDSSAICAYLERKHPEPPLFPRQADELGRALWFEEYGDTALTQVAGAKVFFKKIVAPRFLGQPVDEAGIRQAVEQDLPPLFDYLESQLGDAEGIAGGRFSIGDVGIVTHFVNLRHAGVGVDPQRWPRLARYVARTLERPSFAALWTEEAPLLGSA